jgi:hypothetical protein
VQDRGISTYRGEYEDFLTESDAVLSDELRALRADLDSKVQLFITDPPRQGGFGKKDMAAVAIAAHRLLHPKGTAIIFCARKDIDKWLRELGQAGLSVQEEPLHFVLSKRDAHTPRHGTTMTNVMRYACVVHKTKDFFVDYSLPLKEKSAVTTAGTPSH